MIIEGRITHFAARVRGLDRAMVIYFETTDTPARQFRTIPPSELLPSLVRILAVGVPIRVDGTISQPDGEEFSDIEMVKLTRLADDVIPWAMVAPQLKLDRYA